MSEKRVTISLVQITQETRPEGLMVGKVTYFRLPGADYNQICAALLAAKFEELDTGDKRVTVSLVWVRQDTREEGITVQEGTDFRLPGADYNQICAALLAAKFELEDTVQEALDAKLAEGCFEMNHNSTGCQDQACDLCDAYGDGYSMGKAKGLFEAAIAVGHMSAMPGCGCGPCVSLRSATHALGEGEPRTPNHGRCTVCDREAMVVNSICSRCWG